MFMPVERCAKCGASLGTMTQETMLGVEKLCGSCLTIQRITHILAMLPEEDDLEFDRLSEWEQKFTVSVRDQFSRRGTLTVKQFLRLEEVYDKLK